MSIWRVQNRLLAAPTNSNGLQHALAVFWHQYQAGIILSFKHIAHRRVSELSLEPRVDLSTQVLRRLHISQVPSFASINGRQGCSGVIGHWMVAEPSRITHFDDFNDKGYTGPGSGRRRIESRLWNLQGGDDWRNMCSTTPADFRYLRGMGYLEYRGPRVLVDARTRPPRRARTPHKGSSYAAKPNFLAAEFRLVKPIFNRRRIAANAKQDPSQIWAAPAAGIQMLARVDLLGLVGCQWTGNVRSLMDVLERKFPVREAQLWGQLEWVEERPDWPTHPINDRPNMAESPGTSLFSRSHHLIHDAGTMRMEELCSSPRRLLFHPHPTEAHRVCVCAELRAVPDPAVAGNAETRPTPFSSLHVTIGCTFPPRLSLHPALQVSLLPFSPTFQYAAAALLRTQSSNSPARSKHIKFKIAQATAAALTPPPSTPTNEQTTKIVLDVKSKGDTSQGRGNSSCVASTVAVDIAAAAGLPRLRRLLPSCRERECDVHFLMSDGVAGNAEAEANAVFTPSRGPGHPREIDRHLGTMREEAESAIRVILTRRSLLRAGMLDISAEERRVGRRMHAAPGGRVGRLLRVPDASAPHRVGRRSPVSLPSSSPSRPLCPRCVLHASSTSRGIPLPHPFHIEHDPMALPLPTFSHPMLHPRRATSCRVSPSQPGSLPAPCLVSSHPPP
ncbi:hypothetical protein C8R44DRAFT_747370 [Mycena epipterygia]|nr:hypothetical protein C8R44DRAFT_747370 [Mycena epipterygia]